MTIDFTKMNETVIPNFNGGEGKVSVRMFTDGFGKILTVRIEKGSSIGMHRHENNFEAEFVLKGKARCICDGQEEILLPGMCHYCQNGSEHSMESIGEEDLVLYCVVPNCK